MEYPLVSALIVCYNQAHLVTECLEGVKLQNYPNLEVIVNDDASTDNSVEVIENWLVNSGLSYRFLRSPTNRGICSGLNNALSVASGKYISLIAADDAWLPGKLLTQVEMMEKLPEKVGVLYSDALQMDESGKVLPKRFIESHRQFATMPQGNIERIMWDGNFIPAMSTLIRRKCFDRMGPLDESLFYEDWDMWLQLARWFDFAYSDYVSTKYRLVATSCVRGHWWRMNESLCRVCIKHLRWGKLDSECKRSAALALYNSAIYAFEHATPGNARFLFQAFRYRPTVGIALRLQLAWLGLGPAAFQRVRSAVQKAKFKKQKLEPAHAGRYRCNESARLYLRWARAWLLSLNLHSKTPFSLDGEEKRASASMSVVVAVHDSPEVTTRCLKSLEAFGGEAEIIIVDDGSKLESTRQVLEEICLRNGWKLIRHETALGHSRASEAGASASTRPYVCLLNSDTVITPRSWAGPLRAFETSPQIAVAGPSTSHTVQPQFVKRALHCRHYWSDEQIWCFAEKYVEKHHSEPLVDLDSVGGFAFFVRKSVWHQLGGFDNKLPDYGNEGEFCRRVRESGFRIVWTKASYIHHMGNSSYGRTLGLEGVRKRCVEATAYIQKKFES